MRTISVALKAHLAQGFQTMCSCWQATLASGEVRGFTDHDRDVLISGWTAPNDVLNGTYVSVQGYTGSANTSSNQMDVDQMSVQGPQQLPAMTEEDIHAGVWDRAQIVLFQVNWADLTMGPLYERVGWTGQLSAGRFDFTSELRGLMQAYAQSIGRLYVPGCDANLGDTRCGVKLSPPVWQPLTGYTVATGTQDANVGSIVSPTVYNGFIFYCGTAGTSGASEPSWTLSSGGVTVDGSAVWESLPALTVNSTLTGVNPDGFTLYDSTLTQPGPTGGIAIVGVSNANPGVVTLTSGGGASFADGQVVTISGVVGPALINVQTVIRGLSGDHFQLGIDTSDTSIYPPYVSGGMVTPLGDTSGFFDFGVIAMTSGVNAGLSMEVKSYVPGQVTLFLPFGKGLCAIGDTYTMHAGCDKLPATCSQRFFNILNFRGFPFLPGNDKLSQVGRSQ